MWDERQYYRRLRRSTYIEDELVCHVHDQSFVAPGPRSNAKQMLRRQNLQPSPTLNEYGAVVSEITIKCKMPCMNSASIPFYRYTGTAATLHNNVMHHHRPLASVSSR